MSIAARLAAALLIATSAAHAQTLPYSFSVESFSVPERGIFDDFDDGTLDPAWNGTSFGTIVESGSTLTLSNPGLMGFLPAPIANETTVVSGQGIGVNFSGDFTATSTWTQTVPTFSQGMNLALGSVNSSTGNVHQLSVGLSFTPSEVASVLGGPAGLSIGVLDVIRDSGPGNILSLTRTAIPVLPGDITGDILLSLFFDDTLNTLQPLYSLDGGLTTHSAGAAVPWEFTGGGFSLTGSSSVVPEPGTASLLGLGLVLLGARRPRRIGRLRRP